MFALLYNNEIKKSFDSTDGFVWQCRNYACLHFQTTVSIRRNSIFSNVKLLLVKILKFCFYWSYGLINAEILLFVPINKNSATKLRAFLIDKIKLFLIKFPVFLGGPFKIVHIDETMLTHMAKSHRGRSPRRQIYALCIKEVGENSLRGFCTVLNDRSANSILPIIYRVVIPGTIIHTDEWKSYNQLS